MVHARQTRKEGNITGAQTISIPKQTSSIMQSVISALSPSLASPHLDFLLSPENILAAGWWFR